MADTRGRRSVGGFLGDTWQPSGYSGPPPVGQPVMIRMQGVPTMPGYRDRPGKWNVLIPPFLFVGKMIADLIERLRS